MASGGRERRTPASSSFIHQFDDLLSLPTASQTAPVEKRISLAAMAAKSPPVPVLPVASPSSSMVLSSSLVGSQIYSDGDWELLVPPVRKPADTPAVFPSFATKVLEVHDTDGNWSPGGNRNAESPSVFQEEPQQGMGQKNEASLPIVPVEASALNKDAVLRKSDATEASRGTSSPIPFPSSRISRAASVDGPVAQLSKKDPSLLKQNSGPILIPRPLPPVSSLSLSESPNPRPSLSAEKPETLTIRKNSQETSADEPPARFPKSRSAEAGRVRGPLSRYYPPPRDAVSWERPVALELRPRPAARADNRVRVVACCSTVRTVCAASDDGLRAWSLGCAMGVGSAPARDSHGDEDAAAATLVEVRGARVLCVALDGQQGMLWSGHADGSVRVWPLQSDGVRLPEVGDYLLEWQAHRQPVTALTMTSYGELWTGSEGGSIHAWPSDALARALAEVRDAGKRVCNDLAGKGQKLAAHSQYTDSGGRMHSDVRFLLADRVNGRVWSGGWHSVAVWNARTREFITVVGGRWQFEFGGLAGRGPTAGRDKYFETSEGMFQGYQSEDRDKKNRWKHLLQKQTWKVGEAVSGAVEAVSGAVGVVGAVGAEAVRRDGRRLMALACSPDGSVWVGCATGPLQRWEVRGESAEKLEVIPGPSGLRCLATVGTRLWVGYSDGRISVLSSASGRRLGGWVAHKEAVIQLAVCGDHVISVAGHGGVKAWSAACPSPTVENNLRAAMAARAEEYTKVESINVLTATWNVGETRPQRSALEVWLGQAARGAGVGIVAVGLQEMDMGAGTIALSAAKETVGMGLTERMGNNAQLWLSDITQVLGERHFKTVAWRQLAGMLIGVWVSKDLLPHVGDVETGAVARGFGKALGNKGAVAVRMAVLRRTVCFVSCHLAAHHEAVGRRDEDWRQIYNHMVFGRTMGTVGTAASSVARVAGGHVKSAVQVMLRAAQGAGGKRGMSRLSPDEDFAEPAEDSADGGWTEDSEEKESGGGGEGGAADRCDLAEADLLVWTGDFNYRLDGVSYDVAKDYISRNRLKELLMFDQLKKGMEDSRTFLGMREPDINFPPSYKFDRGDSDPMAYDSGEKRRVPAWCDRVLLRDSSEDSNTRTAAASLQCPVQATPTRYESCTAVLESDHKPVRCMLSMRVAGVDQPARRRLYGRLLTEFAPPPAPPPNLLPSNATAASLELHGNESRRLRLANPSTVELAFSFRASRIFTGGSSSSGEEACGCSLALDDRAVSLQPLAGGLPLWLQVLPASGVIPPGKTEEVEVLHNAGVWSQAAREKVVTLVLEVRRLFAAAATCQAISVQHSTTQSRLQSNPQFQPQFPPRSASHTAGPLPAPDTRFPRAVSDSQRDSAMSQTINVSVDVRETDSRSSAPQPHQQSVSKALPDLLSWD